jgi:hypothetical protein
MGLYCVAHYTFPGMSCSELRKAVEAALSFIARCWLALDEDSGVSLASSEGKCPKKLNSLRSREKWPEESDEPN